MGHIRRTKFFQGETVEAVESAINEWLLRESRRLIVDSSGRAIHCDLTLATNPDGSVTAALLMLLSDA